MADKKTIEAWVAALRSGEYKQAQGQLRDGDRFCCLGVLCDLYAKATKTSWNGNHFQIQPNYLPSDVSRWADLDDEDPLVRIRGRNGTIRLSQLNDGETEDLKPWNFEEIADVIEQNLLK